LYFLALSAWSSVAGESRLALRYLTILAGLLTVAITYRIAADWFGRTTALYTALLLAALRILIYYSQEIRHYGWMVLTVCLATLIFLRYLRRPRTALLIAYTVSIALIMYINYFGILPLLVHIVAGLVIWHGSVRQKLGLLQAYGLALILYLPWLP